MTALLLALAILGGGTPGLECALVVPQPGDLKLADYSVVHDNARGVTLVSRLRPETVQALFDGTLARFVVAGSTALGGGTAQLRLPLSSGELTYVALRDGRPVSQTVLDPTAVNVEARGEASGEGVDLELSFRVVQLAGQENIASLQNAPLGKPTFAERNVGVRATVAFDQPVLVLLESAAEVESLDHGLEMTFRRRIGSRTVESLSPLLGVVVRLVPPGAGAAWRNVQPPLAPVGMVRVAGEVERPGSLIYRFGMQASEVLAATGVRPGAARVSVARQNAQGGVERYQQGLPGGRDDFVLQSRDVIEVQSAAPPATAPGMPAVRAEGMGGGGGMGGAGARGDRGGTMGERGAPGERGPQGMPGAPGAQIEGGAAAQMQQWNQGASRLARSMPLDELRSVAPAAARAATSAVAVRARVQRDGGWRELLLAGTIVSPDGLVVTTPATTLEGAEGLRAVLPGGAEVPLESVGVDSTGLLLALRLPAGRYDALSPGKGEPPLGAALVVMGNPYGLLRSVTVTFLGGPRRDLPGAPGMGVQLDGSLAMGNSGGPVVDLDGRLVGLAYGQLRAEEQGPAVSFAASADLLRQFLNELRKPAK
ncbi:MAG: trypsin-like peptidase domain-containing protein [Armatimonadetes bacterium]|nr:trypsin-like peptidase domain-containing protein [Armatimonadota bacterium]